MDKQLLEQWSYEVIESEGEIHIFTTKDPTVAIASIYSEPLEPEDYERAKLICSLPQLSSTVKELEREVERLKGLIKRMYDGESLPDDYEQFKTENNL